MALTGQELCERLHIDAKQLERWRRAGLPSTGRGKQRAFDPEAVRAWLVATGKAEPTAAASEAAPDQPTATTWAEVAEHFQVSERTVATWIRQGMPGKSGRPGTREGAFPLADIAAWRDGRLSGRATAEGETKNQAQARLSIARAELLELELRHKRGELVEADEVERRWLRFTNEATAQLTPLAARISKSLPDEASSQVRRKARRLVATAVERALAALALFLDQEADAAAVPLTEPTEEANGSDD